MEARGKLRFKDVYTVEKDLETRWYFLFVTLAEEILSNAVSGEIFSKSVIESE